MPAHGGHRAGHFAAHRSADDRQLVLAPVPPHHLAFHRHRLPQLPGRADDFFLLECPLGGIHHILFHHYLCHLQDGKKFLAIFATLKKSINTMEIKIQSLDQIHEAARQFIAEMGDNTVFALYGKWGRARRLSSKPFARSWAFPTSSPPLLSPLSTNTVPTLPVN